MDEKAALTKKVDAIGWAVALIWIGFALLLDVGWREGLLPFLDIGISTERHLGKLCSKGPQLYSTADLSEQIQPFGFVCAVDHAVQSGTQVRKVFFTDRAAPWARQAGLAGRSTNLVPEPETGDPSGASLIAKPQLELF